MFTGEIHLSIAVHADSVNDIAVSPDGSLLATCSIDKTLCVWNIKEDGNPKNRLIKKLGHDNRKHSLLHVYWPPQNFEAHLWRRHRQLEGTLSLA